VLAAGVLAAGVLAAGVLAAGVLAVVPPPHAAVAKSITMLSVNAIAFFMLTLPFFLLL